MTQKVTSPNSLSVHGLRYFISRLVQLPDVSSVQRYSHVRIVLSLPVVLCPCSFRRSSDVRMPENKILLSLLLLFFFFVLHSVIDVRVRRGEKYSLLVPYSILFYSQSVLHNFLPSSLSKLTGEICIASASRYIFLIFVCTVRIGVGKCRGRYSGERRNGA